VEQRVSSPLDLTNVLRSALGMKASPVTIMASRRVYLMKQWRRVLTAVSLPLLLLWAPGALFAQAIINEIRIDQPSDDNDEYFELAGTPGTSLHGLTYLVIGDGAAAAGSGVIEAVVSLTGQTIPPSGFFVVAESTFTLGTANLVTSLNFENGDNVTHLLVQGFTGSNGQDLDTNNDGILDLTPWTAIIDAVALIGAANSELVYSTTTVGPDGSFVPGHVFRSPDSTGDFQIGNFTPPPTTQPQALTIPDIQGPGHQSAFDGDFVTTAGIVTAVDTNGFFLQDASGDGNTDTADGIFVFTKVQPGVAPGDQLNIAGVVTEFTPGGTFTNNLSITQLTVSQDTPGASNFHIPVVSSSNPLPAPVILGKGGRLPPTEVIDDDFPTSYDPQTAGIFQPAQDGLDFFETLEGMRVTVRNAVAVSPTNGFGEIVTVVDKGKHATGLSKRGTINISPADFNPERVQIQFDSGILPGFSVPVNVGDRLGNVTGVVSYNFGNYEVLVTEEFRATTAGLQPEVTKLRPKNQRLAIASFNVLNLDPKVEDIDLVADNDPDEIDDDVGNGRFQAIAEIIVDHLQLPDIIALQEVQDSNGAEITSVTAADETLQRLVDEIASSSNVTYAFIDNPFIGNETSGGQPGGNIRTAFLYNPARVDLVPGSVQTITDPSDQQTNPNHPFFNSRLPLVATFLFNGQEVTVVNNHFSSKGGSAPLFGRIQPSVALQEDPTVNGDVDVRRAQAEAVKTFVDALLANDPAANVVVLGDLNEFEFLSPLAILEQSLTNLVQTLPENERYSFIFDGSSQSLDHLLVSDSLVPGAKFDIVHVNTEFAETPQRASDHDPLLASVKVHSTDPGDDDDDDEELTAQLAK
jgi:endonuclease/exonuclease/phosphatase family metal-dependent hydrolase